MKKIISCIIIFICVFCLVGCKDLTYKTLKPSVFRFQSDGTYEVVFSTLSNSKDDKLCLKVPEEFEGKRVTKLGEIIDPSGLIRKVEISKNITQIEEYFLRTLINLEKIEVSGSNKKYTSLGGILYSKNKEELILCPRKIEGSLSISKNLKVIRENAFKNVEGLLSIKLPSGVTTIGEHAFDNCPRLMSFDFGKSSKVTKISDYMFANCLSLQTITLPSSIVSIGNYAFSKCKSLKNIVVDEPNIEEIGDYAFEFCESFEELTIPYSVKTIGENAFRFCKFKKVIFSEESQLETIKRFAFHMCENLNEIIIPDSTKKIEERCFLMCGLKLVKLSNNLSIIEEGVFKDCSLLREVYLPNSITIVRKSAFYNCYSLETIYYNGTPEQWDEIVIASNNDDYFNEKKVKFNN